MKYLRVTMPDGSKWDVPVHVIAHHCALYWANKMDSMEDHERVFQSEFGCVMGDADELMDWAENNMNWSDVEKDAVKIESSSKVDYREGWANGPKEIVER